MAKTNLLAQNDNLAIESLKQSVGRSVMNLSHTTTFPIDVDGAILPICCVETVPSDSFEISVECLLRQLTPLKVPVMTNFRLNTAFYYCDNRLGWKKWERFMQGGRSGNEVYDIPVLRTARSSDSGVNKDSIFDVYKPLNINYSNTLHTYFGISLNHKWTENTEPTFAEFPNDSNELPVAFPFFDYQIICRDFYTDLDRLPQNPNSVSFYNYNNLTSDWAYSNLFPTDDDEFKLVDGSQHKCGFNTDDDLEHENEIKGCCLDKVRYHEVRPDYFSTSKKAPMRGDAPQLTETYNSTIPAGTNFGFTGDVPVLVRSAYADLQQGEKQLYLDFDLPFPTNSEGTATLDTNMKAIAEVPEDFSRYFQGGTFPVANFGNGDFPLVTANDVSVDSYQGTFTAAEIRLLSQLTVWQELNMLHKPYYNDFLNAHFDGVRVGDSTVEKPIYIGGTSQLVSINEILQTSATSETSALGTQGATAMSLANNYVGKYYCNNYGYIIGVAYIIPDLYYEPAIPRGFSRRTKEDYYSPEFANLSMQATLNKEIFFSNDDEWNNSPWGYTGAFDELRSIPNRIAGDLLNESYSDLQAWVLRRRMSNANKPSMSTSWLSLKNNVEKTAFQVPEMPAFMLQCANYIKAVRPMPKVAIPKAL